MTFAAALFALPGVGTVKQGQATMLSGANKLTISQTSDRAIVEWNGFSIAKGEAVEFVQNSSQSAILNRVAGGQVSQIDGLLAANGQVYLLNPSGIVIGSKGVVDTAGFLASTADYADEAAFMNGEAMALTGANAPIVVEGQIKTDSGDVFLLAKTVTIASGAKVTGSKVSVVADKEYLVPLAEGIYAEAQPGDYEGDLLQAGDIDALDAAIFLADEMVNEGKVEALNAVETIVHTLDDSGSTEAAQVVYRFGETSTLGSIDASDLSINGDGHLYQSADSVLDIAGSTSIDVGAHHILLDNQKNDFVSFSGFGRDVTVQDKNSILLEEMFVQDDLTITAKGDIEGTESIIVNDETILYTKHGNIRLTATHNDFKGLLKLTARDIVITDTDRTNLSGILAKGDFTLNASGLVRDFDALNIHGVTTILNAGHDVVLNNADNHFRTVSIEGVDVTLADKHGLTLGEMNVSDDLTVETPGMVKSSGSITVGDVTTIKAGLHIILENAANDFGGVVNFTGKSARVTDLNSVDLGDISVTGALTVRAAGRVRDLGEISVKGRTTILNAGGDVILDNPNNDFTSVVAEGVDVTFYDRDRIHFAGLTVADDLVVRAGGHVLDSGSIVVGDTTSIIAQDGLGNVFLNDSGNDFGGLVYVKAAHVMLQDINEISLHGIEAGGNLTVRAGGRIRDYDALTVVGGARFESGQDVVLNNGANDFSTVRASGIDVVLHDVNDITLGHLAVADDLYINAGGDVFGWGHTRVGDTTTVLAEGHDISFYSHKNDFTGLVTLKGHDIKVRDENAIDLSGVTATGDLTVRSAGLVRDFDPITVAGHAVFNNSGFDIVLNNPANDFNQLSATGLEIKVFDVDGIDLVKFNAADDFYLTAGGNVTDSDRLRIADQIHIKTPGNITLDTKKNDFSRFEGSGNDITVHDWNDLVLNDIQAENLTVYTRGNITVLDQIYVEDTLSLNSSTISTPSSFSLLSYPLPHKKNKLHGGFSIFGSPNKGSIPMTGIEILPKQSKPLSGDFSIYITDSSPQFDFDPSSSISGVISMGSPMPINQ